MIDLSIRDKERIRLHLELIAKPFLIGWIMDNLSKEQAESLLAIINDLDKSALSNL
jgi:hypothetical protein